MCCIPQIWRSLMSEIITLAHGSGGKLTHNLIKDVFAKHLANDILLQGDDAAGIELTGGRFAFTTDSFVISPIFFKGGDIGKLAVCGTVNDLAAAGAKPLYLTCGFIIEEGLLLAELERIVESMGETAKECGVKIVAGDTKVVQRGAADKVFINTSGIGIISGGINVSGANAKAGDKIIITGPIGDHGCSILLEREMLNIGAEIKSDCAPLNLLVENILNVAPNIHALRDPTRGGLATTLNEIASQSNVGIRLFEDKIPVRDEVQGVCELLGMDPLYLANEGKMIIIAPESSVDAILEVVKQDRYGVGCCVIGEVVSSSPKRVTMKTITGGSRVVDMLVGDQLPRIC
ncbi:MAG: hydrogenase expression/formation protein HypE [Clostridia bacterium]|nr:hydrogenase expression/formation protein HypE [Clostridia bacterium]